MRAIYPILLMMLATGALADIGEKLRLGLNVNNVPQKNFNAGLQAPVGGNIFNDNLAAATSHSNSNDENNLDRLCNDPFHSFLCKPVGPRKNYFDGRLRSGAQIPSNTNFFQPSKSGEAQLATGIQPSSSFNLPSFQTSPSQPGPSNQYLPSKFDPLPPQQGNVQLPVPVQQPQQNFFTYIPPPPRPPQSSFNQQPTFSRPLPTQPPRPLPTQPPRPLPTQPPRPLPTQPPRPLPTQPPRPFPTQPPRPLPTQPPRPLPTQPPRPLPTQPPRPLTQPPRPFPTQPPRPLPTQPPRPLTQPPRPFPTQPPRPLPTQPPRPLPTQPPRPLPTQPPRPLPTQPPRPPVQTFPPATRPPQITYPTQTSPPAPSNQYLPIEEQIDIRFGSSNVSPLLQGSAQLSTGIRKNPRPFLQGEAQLAEGIPSSRKNPTPISQGESSLATGNNPRKEERHHTLEELCNDAFHSFLCKPITTPRKRIDGRIRPGAKIPPHVLQGATTSGSSAQKLPPIQQTGSAQLAEGIPNPNILQGYNYRKQEIIPSFTFQATNQLPIQNFLIPKQKVTPDKVPERIPPPNFQSSFASQAANQNFLIPKQKVIPDKIPQPKFSLNNQYVFQTNQQPVQTFLTSTVPPPTLIYQHQNLFSSNNQLPSQNFFSTNNPFTASTPCIHTNFNFIPVTTPAPYPVIFQNPIAESAQISSQLSPFNNINQLAQSGYDYSTPQAPFTYPTTTTTTTQRPTVSTTVGYDYPKPSKPFTIPTQNYPIQTVTQSAIPSNQQQFVITTPKPQLNNDNGGYYYQKPSQQFTLPTTTTVRPPTTNEGYTYPKPANPFTLPARTQLTNIPQFNTILTPLQVYNEQYQIPFNTIISEPTNGDDPLPPASQFLILKP